MLRKCRLATFALAVVCVLFPGYSDVAWGVPVQTVALTGQHAPGEPPGIIITQLSTPRFDGARNIIFELIPGEPGGPQLGTSIVLGTPGNLTVAARTGQSVPGTVGLIYESFDFNTPFPLGGAGGEVIFKANFSGPNATPGTREAVLSFSPSGTQILARGQMSAPGAPGGMVFVSRPVPITAPPDGLGLWGAVQPPGGGDLHYGAWSRHGGVLQLIALEGNTAPMGEPGINYGPITGPGFGVARNGAVSFAASLTGIGINPSNDAAIFAGTPGNISLVARSADPVPDGASGERFAGTGQFSIVPFADPVINSSGIVAFGASIAREGQSNSYGLFAGKAGTLRAVARAGQQAPGLPAGISFQALFTPLIDDDGRLAFGSTLAGTGVQSDNDSALFFGGADLLQLVVREGSQAPGLPDGVLFDELPSRNFTSNAHGQLIFMSELVGPGTTDANRRSIWLKDPNGELSLLLRAGDMLDVGNGDLRTVSFLSFASRYWQGERVGQAQALTPDGQFAFAAGFTDGSSGIFVTTIPEPALGTLILLALCFSRRRKGKPDWSGALSAIGREA